MRNQTVILKELAFQTGKLYFQFWSFEMIIDSCLYSIPYDNSFLLRNGSYSPWIEILVLKYIQKRMFYVRWLYTSAIFVLSGIIRISLSKSAVCIIH